jgi:hypothetical protein
MIDFFTFWSLVAAALIVFLVITVTIRHRREARELALLGQMRRAFDVAQISPQISELRKNYVAATRVRRCLPSHYRAGLMVAARRMIAGLDYFRSSREEHKRINSIAGNSQ